MSHLSLLSSLFGSARFIGNDSPSLMDISYSVELSYSADVRFFFDRLLSVLLFCPPSSFPTTALVLRPDVTVLVDWA